MPSIWIFLTTKIFTLKKFRGIGADNSNTILRLSQFQAQISRPTCNGMSSMMHVHSLVWPARPIPPLPFYVYAEIYWGMGLAGQTSTCTTPTYPVHKYIVFQMQQLLGGRVRAFMREKTFKRLLGIGQSVQAERVPGQTEVNVVFC